MRILLIALISLALCGCGTLLARSGALDSHDYYKGVRADVRLLHSGPGYGYLSPACWMSLVCPLATVVSLPVDAAVDTLLLPWDAQAASRH